jgi:hypothetical protein
MTFNVVIEREPLSILQADKQMPLTAFRELFTSRSFTLVSELLQRSIDFSHAHLVNLIADIHK